MLSGQSPEHAYAQDLGMRAMCRRLARRSIRSANRLATSSIAVALMTPTVGTCGTSDAVGVSRCG